MFTGIIASHRFHPVVELSGEVRQDLTQFISNLVAGFKQKHLAETRGIISDGGEVANATYYSSRDRALNVNMKPVAWISLNTLLLTKRQHMTFSHNTRRARLFDSRALDDSDALTVLLHLLHSMLTSVISSTVCEVYTNRLRRSALFSRSSH
jgi:hypothetical protein